MPTFETDNAALHYDEIGSGPPLLLIAGTASDGASWGPLVPRLEKSFRLVMFDNRGSGQTRHAGPIRFDDMVGDCAALIDHLNLAPTAVLGHSLGGLIGLHLAARHPNRVSRLLTMGAGVSPKAQTLLGDLAAIYEGDRPELFFRLLFQFLFSAPFFADPDIADNSVQASMDYAFRQSPADFRRQVAMFETLGPLDTAAIAAPVLAIAGGADILVPPADVAAMHDGISRLETVTIPAIGHSIHWEAVDEVAERIEGFFSVA